jgi:hypothetical protein
MMRRFLAQAMVTLVSLVALSRAPLAQSRPDPLGPYPAQASGWGPSFAGGLSQSRWAEDWSSARKRGAVPAGKALALGGGATLSLSAETRLRSNVHDNARLQFGADKAETLWRGVLGAELRFDERVRVFAELGSGSALDGDGPYGANFANEFALNQAFVDLSRREGDTLLGALLGRQEFADGPRQLMSVSDGPNLHRTWNGVRLYAHGRHARAGAFGFCATRLGEHVFDERIDCEECLRGANASFVLTAFERERSTFLDPFWFHSELPGVPLQGSVADDRRDTFGVRLWGRDRSFGFDLTLARQVGQHGEHDVNAWALFSGQNVRLSDASWEPRATLNVDVASGGSANAGTQLRTFHPLYSSSNYLGEGRLLSLANLVRIAPGLSITPTPRTRLSLEYGWAWRYASDDAVYGLGLRAYPGTNAGSDNEIGRLFRIEGRWSDDHGLSVALGFEHLQPAEGLAAEGLASGAFAFASLTFRH